MKKLLIFSHGMELGGAETALLGLLETIDTENYETDLFLMRHSGPLLKFVPSGINLLSEKVQYASLAVPFKDVLRHRQFKVAYGRLRGKRKAEKQRKALGITGENDIGLEYSHKYTCKYMPVVSEKNYDLAISFLTPHYFVAQKVQALKKIAWIHTDYSVVQVDIASETEMWAQYDGIISISESVSETFLRIFPSLKDKVHLIENILPQAYIIRKSSFCTVEGEMPDDGSIKLLTIGRFSPQKKMDEIPEICRKIREQGVNVKWYIIGYGGEEPLIRQKIAEAGMEACVKILGKKENPYPYIKACDVYVQPSRYEGKSVVVREAQMLAKPVIITNYATAPSQLEDGVDGVIVPIEIDACAREIARVLRDTEMLRALSEACKARDYSNRDEVKKIYALMNEKEGRTDANDI